MASFDRACVLTRRQVRSVKNCDPLLGPAWSRIETSPETDVEAVRIPLFATLVWRISPLPGRPGPVTLSGTEVAFGGKLCAAVPSRISRGVRALTTRARRLPTHGCRTESSVPVPTTPAAPRPATPEPTTSGPVGHERMVPEPAIPEPAIPEPAIPEPAIPEPMGPQPMPRSDLPASPPRTAPERLNRFPRPSRRPPSTSRPTPATRLRASADP